MKTKHFVIDVKMGNDAMQTFEDLASMLENVAYTMRFSGPTDAKPQPFHSRTILDPNGSTVGTWNIEYREGEE